jgi:predicted transcriptional regulator
MNKADILEIVRELPDDEEVDVQRLIYTLYVRAQVDRGLADADAGRAVFLEEIDRMIDEWPE